MKAYLAEKYMSGPKADAILARTTTKKKKRKAGTSNSTGTGSGAGPSGFVVDDDVSWVAPPKDEEEDDLEDAVVVKDRSFKRRKVDPSGGQSGATKSGGEGGGGWTTIQEGAAREDGTPPPTADELPQIAGVVEDAPSTVSGGLLTKAQLRKKLGPKPSERDKRAEEAEEIARQQETVYRDASGRKIDMKAEKAEAARRKREAEEKEARKMEWGKGLAQREEKERERTLMEKERHKGFARHADDAELNEEQKAKELWNDPAAAFLMVRPSATFHLSAQIPDGPTEETEQGPAETGVHRPGPSAKPVRDQARIPVGRSGPGQRLRAEILSTPKRTEASRGGELFVERGRHVTFQYIYNLATEFSTGPIYTTSQMANTHTDRSTAEEIKKKKRRENRINYTRRTALGNGGVVP